MSLAYFIIARIKVLQARGDHETASKLDEVLRRWSNGDSKPLI